MMIKVIVLESDPTLAWLLREELEDAGFGVRVCRDLHHAQSALGMEPFDILLSDVCNAEAQMASALGALGRIHRCSVVLLGPKDRSPVCTDDPVMLRKSSDMQPLISCLRRQAAKALWLRSTPANA